MLGSRLFTTFVIALVSMEYASAQSSLPNLISPYSIARQSQKADQHNAPEVPRGHAFEWIVSIGHAGMSHALGGHFCGGSIIANKWILTAAHCLIKKDNDGSYSPVDSDKIQIKTGYELHTGGSYYEVAKIILHEDYHVTPFNSLVNDIALIKTKEDVNTYGTVDMLRPVDEGYIGQNVVVLGWGKPRAYLNYLSERLRYLQLQLIENTRCDQNYYSGLIDDNMICALGNGSDACQGDSGGPLVAFDDQNDFFLYGIVSWGEQCGGTLKPGIYVSIPNYFGWIRSQIASN